MYKTSKIKFQQKNSDIKNLSAEKVVSILFDIFKPKSVIDVGCGTGLLLKHFQKKGSTIMGYEGKWINKDLIEDNISNNLVKIIDFEQLDFINIKESELCICLEVAEHISFEQAEIFVNFITLHSKLIIFSAAIPYQGGFNHINEQWSDFWDLKFSKFGYVKYDILRPILWDQDLITWPHKQNMVVYLHNSEIEMAKQLRKMEVNNLKNPIHFENYINKTKKYLSIINFQESTFFYLRLFIKKLLK
jgi:hypothetical protein